MNFKRDSLEDIFLKAMESENAGEAVSQSVNDGNVGENGNARANAASEGK